MKEPECPVCNKEGVRLSLTGRTETTPPQAYVGLWCPECKKAMTITGVLAWTAEEVNEMRFSEECDCETIREPHQVGEHDWCCQHCGGSHTERFCPKNRKEKGADDRRCDIAVKRIEAVLFDLDLSPEETKKVIERVT